MLSDFGSKVFEQIGTEAFQLRVMPDRVMHAQYSDRLSFTFIPATFFISSIQGGKAPIIDTACMITIEAFCRRPSKDLATKWIEDRLKREPIHLRAAPELAYVAESGERVMPCLLVDDSLKRIMPVTSFNDLTRIANAQAKRDRRKQKVFSGKGFAS